MDVNFRICVKITTDIKLNMINNEGESLIQLDNVLEKKSKEVHYIQLEGTQLSYPLSWSMIWQMFKQSRKSHLEVRDWIITDFDHNLLGNPLIPTHYEENFKEM